MTKLRFKLSDVEEMINGRIEQLRKPLFHQKNNMMSIFILKTPSSLLSLPTQD